MMSTKVHEAYCLDSMSLRCDGFDHFWGDSLDARWTIAGTGSVAVVDAQDGGIVRLTTGATSGNTTTLSWGNFRSLLVSKKLTVEMRLKLTQTANTRAFLRYIYDLNDNFGFEYNSASDASWHIQADSGGTTDVDTNVAADTSYHIYKIECFPTGEVHFFIDDVETANSPITTNITVLHLQPHIVAWTLEDLAKSMDIDYVWWRQDR